MLANITITLDPDSGFASVPLLPGWIAALHIRVTDTSGTVLSWPFHLVDSPAGDIVLDSLTYAQAGFWLEPSEVQLIPPGQYELIAILDSSAYGTAIYDSPNVISIPRSITISNLADSGGIAQTSEKDILLANLNILKGDTAKAAEFVNGILAYSPDNLTALSLSGILSEGSGNAGGALDAYSKGLGAFYQQNPTSQEPPVELLRTEKALLTKLDTATSFVVTLAVKDSTHPFYGHGSASCYYIDRIPIREVQFIRGKTYTFRMKNVPSTDPFYFSTDIKGGGAQPYTDGVSGAPADSNDQVIITVAGNAPDTLYYQSAGNQFVGWKINVMDSATITSVANQSPITPKEYSLSAAYPNPFNPSTTIGYTLPQTSHVKFKVFNILGQVVATLIDGVERAGHRQIQFNAGDLPSGVYFYRLEATGIDGAVPAFSLTRKVLLLK